METGHPSTRAVNQKIERLQKRALRCIVGDVTYEEARSMFELSTLADRREELM